MIIVLSPAKSLDMTPVSQAEHTLPILKSDANKLVKNLKQYDMAGLRSLMSISEKLAIENVTRYNQFKPRGYETHGKRAIDTFVGDVYRGLNVGDFKKGDYNFAQKHLRILSGLYGVLRPLDMMQPYRLEMGTKLTNERGKNLYEYWGTKITNEINKDLRASKESTLINLASEEYFKSIKKDKLKGDILTINFKEYKGDQLKFVSFTAKVARGMMARYIIKNRIKNLQDIKGFSEDRYSYSDEHSSENNWLFVR